LFSFEEDRLVVELDSLFSQPLKLKTTIPEGLEESVGLFVNLSFSVAIDKMLLDET
jgi:hypothetical protein